MVDLYQNFNDNTKQVIKNSFMVLGRKGKENIGIDPIIFEIAFAQIINNFEKNTICNHLGSNNCSFDILIIKNNENIAISLKTRNINEQYSKLQEMSFKGKNKNKINKLNIDSLRMIIEERNDKIKSENKQFNLSIRKTFYYEKSTSFIRVLEGEQNEIVFDEITNIMFEKDGIRFEFKEEQYYFRLNNYTLYQTRKKYKLVDIYNYEDNDIIKDEDVIYNFISNQKNILYNENYINIIDAKENKKGRNDIMMTKTRNDIDENQLKEILNSKEICSEYNMYFSKITPSIARYILENHQTTNREIKKKKVEEYKKYIKEDRWNERTGNNISFDSNGMLTDGQHRLHAIAELDDSYFIETWITTGTIRSEHKDTGVKRSTYDNVLYMGICPEECRPFYTNKFNAALMFHCHFFGNNSQDSVGTQHNYLKYFFENHSQLLIDIMSPWEEDGKQKSLASCSILLNRPVLAAIINAFAMSIINKEDIKHITNVMIDGYSPRPGNQDAQLIGLRDYLNIDCRTKKTTSISSDGLSAEQYKIVSAFIKGYKMGKLIKKPSKSKKFPPAFNFGGCVRKHVDSNESKPVKSKIIA